MGNGPFLYEENQILKRQVHLIPLILFMGCHEQANGPPPKVATVEKEAPEPLVDTNLEFQPAHIFIPAQHQTKEEVPLSPPVLTELEQRILEVALTCKRAKKKYRDPVLLTKLILMEREFDIPKDLRGMLLASACTESGYNPNAEGDHKFSKRGKPKAIGLLQLWPWWTAPVEKGGYGINRREPLVNARSWLTHIDKQRNKVRKKCRISKHHVSRIWRVAWVTGIRAPKPEGRCNEFPNHYHRLKKWKRQWASLL